LPRGVQSLAGTPFDVRGMVSIEAANSSFAIAPFPVPAVSRIPVGRHCRELHFLQAVELESGLEGGTRLDGQEDARWVIHSADGAIRVWPIIYGEHLRDWWLFPSGLEEASKAAIAWEGHPTFALTVGAENVRLFKATWSNPSPGIEVSHLDFVVARPDVRPFVIAITAE
jgi:hypothetical protein